MFTELATVLNLILFAYQRYERRCEIVREEIARLLTDLEEQYKALPPDDEDKAMQWLQGLERLRKIFNNTPGLQDYSQEALARLDSYADELRERFDVDASTVDSAKPSTKSSESE